MKRVTVDIQQATGAEFAGAVLCRDISFSVNGKRTQHRRGTPVVDILHTLPDEQDATQLHLLVPDESDLTQEEASQRLAERVTGDGIDSTEPHQGQVDLRSGVFGMLRVRPEAVADLNREGAWLVATALDGRVVEPGETVGIVKASELLVPEAAVDEAVGRIGELPVIDIVPFSRSRVALIAGDRIREPNLKVSSKHLAAGLQRYGAELSDVRKIPDDPDGIARNYRELIDSGIELVLVAGSIVLDPEDPYLEALERIDAELVRRGAPIDPGTMFWVARKEDIYIFGLASCEMYGRLSIIDLFLPYALAGQTIDNDLISRLGYGGLLNDTHEARKPAGWRSNAE